MTAVEILLGRWPLVLALVAVFLAAIIVAQVVYALNRYRAFELLAWLDAKREPILRFLQGLYREPFGVLKAIGFIFAINLLGASLLQHTLGGLLVVPPFVSLFVGGLVISLIARRYPERLLITLVVAPFEFGAFIVAATGGISIGASLWSGDPMLRPFQEWLLLFLTLVVPLQFLNAVLEGWLAYRLFILRHRAWV